MFKSGEIYLADIPLGYSEFVYGKRPVIIFQDKLLESNFDSGIFVIPLSTGIGGLNDRYAIEVPFIDIQDNNVSLKSNNVITWIRCDLLFKINKKYLIKRLGYSNQNILEKISDVISDLFNIKNNTYNEISKLLEITLINRDDYYKYFDNNFKNIQENFKKMSSLKSKWKEFLIGFILGIIASIIASEISQLF